MKKTYLEIVEGIAETNFCSDCLSHLLNSIAHKATSAMYCLEFSANRKKINIYIYT